ncbi:hypothetical protein CEUSTIGMA_g11141.t1 [Chlamydomonas eustigma]|uniref:U1-type domain-containing protein n=1 Tax=Chlamydomonas eustigma TaxID=1157962 RepID=A0A250XL13_9CHLO|nr:hypothetical protein CEUSTIGMA_g11141.t1 [Chlamydomonas eustigma]|eukprot:GAX83716.1 hypothetical protein CEUSTIGMA_g11141.t1 [Chlamydomonas eustigma]
MFKRRDWLHTKGADGGHTGNSDSDSDDDSNVLSPSHGLEENEVLSYESDENELSEDEGQELEGPRDSEEEEDVTAEDVIRIWTNPDPDVHKFKGIPLRCVACKALLLNRTTYMEHVSSKAHNRKIKGLDPQDQALQLATESLAGDEEEAETHMERLERMRMLATGSIGGKDTSSKEGVRTGHEYESSSDEGEGDVDRKSVVKVRSSKLRSEVLKGAGLTTSNEHVPVSAVDSGPAISNGENRRVPGHSRKRPGKRQRAALKAEGKDPSTGKRFKARKKAEEPEGDLANGKHKA